MNKIPFLILLIFLSACYSTKNTPNKELLEKYRIQIGCSNYGTLRLAPGDNKSIIDKVVDDHSQFQSKENLTTAIVYRGLNKDILFIHLVYRNSTQERRTVNYIYDIDDEEIVGNYQCFQ